jgi:hypothetical protein
VRPIAKAACVPWQRADESMKPFVVGGEWRRGRCRQLRRATNRVRRLRSWSRAHRRRRRPPGCFNRRRIVRRPLGDQPGEPEYGDQNSCDCGYQDLPGRGNPLSRRLFSMRGLSSVPAPCVQPTWRRRRCGDQGYSRHAASSQALAISGAVTILHDANARNTDPRPRVYRRIEAAVTWLHNANALAADQATSCVRATWCT